MAKANPREYGLIVIGSGSGMSAVEPFMRRNPGARVAVIEKDPPGGICLTRGCIPTKLLTYPADLVRLIEEAPAFGIRVAPARPDFAKVMKRMRGHIDPEIASIGKGLRSDPRIDFFPKAARFVAPRVLEVGGELLASRFIILCTGSKPTVANIEGLESIDYHTTDSILHLTKRPASMVIVGGGYIAAEFGHFFSAMGTKVTVLGRNKRFLANEEPEVSARITEKLRKLMRIETGAEVVAVAKRGRATRVTFQQGGRRRTVETGLLLIAAGRSSNADVLDPAVGGVKVDKAGWIQVDDRLETSQKGVWALGDALGRHQFKHTANYEIGLLVRNALLDESNVPDYSAVPHAVFTYPEVAAVGMREAEAIERFGAGDVLVGRYRYEDTAKGQAIGAEGDFAKVIAQASTRRIVGAHIVGPYASILIQEVINVMHAPGATLDLVADAMHIHPALPEVVERACLSMAPVRQENKKEE